MKGAALGLVLVLALSVRDDLKIGEPVPDIALKTLDGKELRLSDFRKDGTKNGDGEVVVIYFQSVKCPSRLKAGTIKDMAGKLTADSKPVRFIAVFAYGHDSRDVVSGFVQEHALPYPCVLDDGKAVARHLGARKVNTTYVLGRDGKLVYRGAFVTRKGEPVAEAVKAALEGTTPPASDGRFAG